MRIALDAMGSDNFPVPDVAGAVLAAQEYGDTILLVGDAAKIEPELAKHATAGLHLQVVHASDIITMHDKPSTVGKAKPNSSIHVGMNLVKNGEADAFVTAGNTGAALSIATLYTLRRIPGVKRPALTGIVRIGGRAVILVDVGANADSKPEWLEQFALMGKIYAKSALGLDDPGVGILSNGEEEGKGNELIRESSELIAKLPLRFVGNIEPKDLLSGTADVVVSDGFVGNILIKSMEATSRLVSDLIRQEIMASTVTKIGGALAKPAFDRVRKQTDPFEVGGAPLLGVNGVVIIGHGRSNDRAIKNAIGQARKAVSGQVIASITRGLQELGETERR